MPRNSPLRVLHVTNSLRRGGIETWLLNVLRRLDPQDIRFDFAVNTSPPGECASEIEACGGRVFVCKPANRPWTYGPRFLKILRDHGPYDIVHSHFSPSGYPLYWAAKGRVPVRIAHSHNDLPEMRPWGPLMGTLLQPIADMLVQRYSTSGIAASERAGKSLYGTSWNDDKRWRVLFCGIDLEPFDCLVDRSHIRKSLGISADSIVIGHVGNFKLGGQKNHEFIIRVATKAMRVNPRIRLLLVGDGSPLTAFQQMVCELGIEDKVVFAGSRSDVPKLLLGAMDMFFFPSKWEGLGLAAVEAQAAGLPTLMSNVIPKEADVVPSLIRRLPLSAPVESWVQAVLEMTTSTPAVSQTDALEIIRCSPLNIDVSARSLLNCYRECCSKVEKELPNNLTRPKLIHWRNAESAKSVSRT